MRISILIYSVWKGLKLVTRSLSTEISKWISEKYNWSIFKDLRCPKDDMTGDKLSVDSISMLEKLIQSLCKPVRFTSPEAKESRFFPSPKFKPTNPKSNSLRDWSEWLKVEPKCWKLFSVIEVQWEMLTPSQGKVSLWKAGGLESSGF